MSRCLGVYYCPMHGRQGDKDYIRALQAVAVRILNPDIQHILDVHALAPAALILPRDHALSEQHEDVERDPEGTGKRHAQEWRDKVDGWRNEAAARGATFPPDAQIVVVGENEPHVWDNVDAPVRYTVAFLDECTRLGLRACALNLSVGWPANSGPDTPPDWTPYEPVHAALVGTDHLLTLHEYWYRTGPVMDASHVSDGCGWLAYRHHFCPWPDVKILIGECGVDNYVDAERWNTEGGNRGWRGNLSPQSYSDQMGSYISRCDTRVVAVLPFLTDYQSNEWESFDTAEAHPHLVDLFELTPSTAPPEGTEGPAPGPEPPAGATPPIDVQAIWHPLPNGVITQRFGENPDAYIQFGQAAHNGVDFGGVAAGTPIQAIAEGTVAYTGWDAAGYGWYVRIGHPHLRFYSHYSHMQAAASCIVGERVSAGQVIGYVGSTGFSTAAHLHYECRLMQGDGSYAQAQVGYTKGRVCPETVMFLLGCTL